MSRRRDRGYDDHGYRKDFPCTVLRCRLCRVKVSVDLIFRCELLWCCSNMLQVRPSCTPGTYHCSSAVGVSSQSFYFSDVTGVCFSFKCACRNHEKQVFLAKKSLLRGTFRRIVWLRRKITFADWAVDPCFAREKKEGGDGNRRRHSPPTKHMRMRNECRCGGRPVSSGSQSA